MGFCITTISWKGKTLRDHFILIQSSHQKLIGRMTAVSLSMVTLNLHPDHATDTSLNQVNEPMNQDNAKPELSKAELAARFLTLFSGK